MHPVPPRAASPAPQAPPVSCPTPDHTLTGLYPLRFSLASLPAARPRRSSLAPVEPYKPNRPALVEVVETNHRRPEHSWDPAA